MFVLVDAHLRHRHAIAHSRQQTRQQALLVRRLANAHVDIAALLASTVSPARPGNGHEDRRTLQRYLQPSKEGTHCRLVELDTQRGTWMPSADKLAARMP